MNCQEMPSDPPDSQQQYELLQDEYAAWLQKLEDFIAYRGIEFNPKVLEIRSFVSWTIHLDTPGDTAGMKCFHLQKELTALKGEVKYMA